MEKFQQRSEFEWGRIIGLREGGFSYHAIRSSVQRNSSTVMQIWKQWTDNSKNWQWTMKGSWSTAAGVLLSASSIRRRLLHRGLRARVPLTANHRWLRLQRAHEHRAWQVVFSYESRFNRRDHLC
ncbi:transposable element Tc1 transposase [Trichonephila clavipes]|nr:transposable element Tc1 transposase [Trichonephila clavipes]